MTGKRFSVWLNNEYIPDNPDKIWLKEAYSKVVKKSIEDGCTAFTRFFKHQSAFPNFKRKGKSDVKMYFVKTNPKDCRCERHRLNIPTLGWIRMKEKGYIPCLLYTSCGAEYAGGKAGGNGSGEPVCPPGSGIYSA